MKLNLKRQQLLSLLLLAGVTSSGPILVSHAVADEETQTAKSDDSSETLDSSANKKEKVKDRLKKDSKVDSKKESKDSPESDTDDKSQDDSIADLLQGNKDEDEQSNLSQSITAEGPVFGLADVERLALQNNPALNIAEAGRTKAQGLYQQVGTRPNPTLGYFGQQIADRNTDQHGLFIEQEFVRGGKLALNRQVLAHTAQAQGHEINVQRYRLLTDVRTVFFAALAAQQRRDATLEFSKLADRGVEIAEARFKAEEGTRIEILQAETLVSEIALALDQAEIEYVGSWAGLSAIAGIPSATPIRLDFESVTPAEKPAWESELNQILATSPQLAAARAIVCEKQALIQRQKAQPISNITTQFGAGYDAATDHGLINLQVSAPLPTVNKNVGNISAAYADYTRAVENVERIERSIRSQMAQTSQAHDTAYAAVRIYEDEILPQVLKSMKLSESAYAAGELDFLQVLVVRRSYYEATIRLIAARRDLAQASAKVDGLFLAGGLDQPADYTDGDGIRSASIGGQ
jgi:outer membrane protein, heavy metal efflux system